MSTRTFTGQGASMEELADAMPDAPAGYLKRCVELGLTADQATGMWQGPGKEEEEDKQAKAAQRLAAASPGGPGIPDRPSTGDDYDGNPMATWEKLIVAEQERRGCARHEAVTIVARQNPDLRVAVVRHYNATRGRMAAAENYDGGRPPARS